MLKPSLRNHLSRNFSDPELKRWFDPLSFDVIEDDKRVLVHFPHAFFGSWFAQNVQDRFETELGLFLGNGFTVGYIVGQAHARPVDTVQPPVRTRPIDFPFGRQFTFDTFLVNRKNDFPLASAREVVKQSTIIFNPFVVCGEAGSGKTHLSRAIANELARKPETPRIGLYSVEDVAELYSARFPGDPFKAREFLFSHDVLVVDDFQLVRNHDGLEQELVSVFDHFFDHKKQMIFACSGKLAAYGFLDPKLKSRLEWGLLVTLKKPDLDIRVQFIQRQMRERRIHLSKEQVLALAQRFQDFRTLHGILIKLFAFQEFSGGDMGPRDFERIVSHAEDKPRPALSPEAVMEAVAGHYGLEVKDLKSSRRHHKVVEARQVAMCLCRQLLGLSYPVLGRLFGGKDHSTVLYAVNKILKLQQVNGDMKKMFVTLTEKCLSMEQN